jgi:hypothetical protein
MFNKKAKKEEVYSSTDLSDLLSSPVFYSVIALTFILGVSSVFGFFNNPRKLKTVVDVISQKLLINPSSNTVTFDRDDDYLLQKYSLKASVNNQKGMSLTTAVNSYNVFSKIVVLDFVSNTINSNEIQRVSFDYDITSKQFWGNIDTSRIDSLIEGNQKLDENPLMIGAPLSSEYSLEQGDKKYSMGAGLLRL